jgi:hypothetical protein
MKYNTILMKLRINLKNSIESFALQGSEYDPVMGFCGDGGEQSGSTIKGKLCNLNRLLDKRNYFE